MRSSSNPAFARQGFGRGGGYAGFGQQPQAGSQQQAPGGNPFAQQNQYGGRQSPEQAQQMYGAPPAAQAGRMTMDDVVSRTGMTLGTLIVFGALAWWMIPVGNYGPAIAAALAALVVGMFITFKRKVSPALILTYAALEGVFIGVLSHTFNDRWPGIVAQAVLGTVAVFAGMLIAYKTGAVRVNRRFARIGMAVAIAFVLMTAVNLIVAVLVGGDGLGLRSNGPMGILFGVIGIALGAFFLAMDFNEVERGIAMGVPAREAWWSAFGLTLSLVWLYMELLRLIAIFRD
jgi:uncharacterized YccA/Bax inhibitor family protein